MELLWVALIVGFIVAFIVSIIVMEKIRCFLKEETNENICYI